jgi:hypothetical protein
VGGLGRRCIRLASLGMVAALGILVACGGQGTLATSAQSSTAVFPETPSSPTVQATSAVIPTATLSHTVTPTAAPSPTVPSTPSPTVLPQTASLKLEVTTPAENTVVTSEFVTVAGLTSPDATVSVNGILVLPDSQGHFSVDLPLPFEDNPLPIEVIATSISGEQRSVVLTVIFVR